VVDILNTLIQKAYECADRILEKVSEDGMAFNNDVNDYWENISKGLLTLPNTVDEMIVLQKLITDTRTVDIKKMIEAMDLCKRRFLFIISYRDLKREEFEFNNKLLSWPARINTILSESDSILGSSRQKNEQDLQSRKERLVSDIETLYKNMSEFMTYGDIDEINKYLKSSQKTQVRIDALLEKVKTLNHEEIQMGWANSEFPRLAEAIEFYTPYNEKIGAMSRNLYTLNQRFTGEPNPFKLILNIQNQFEIFKGYLPLVRVLCSKAIRPRHWIQISEITSVNIVPDDSTILQPYLDMKEFNQNLDKLEALAGVASKEFSFEKALAKMHLEWKDISFALVSYRDTGTFILSTVDDIQTLLDDHIVKTQTMRGSPFIRPFEQETKEWETLLLNIQEGVDEWLKVQMTWLYLEPIFGSEDILKQMPTEGKKFKQVDKLWREIMSSTNSNPNVVQVFKMENLPSRLREANEELELVQKGLSQYLEVKRLYFPRKVVE
jgi:dynein heavy chain